MGMNLMSLASSGDKFLKLYGDRKMVKQLPYDAEVKYIEAERNQYIATGVLPEIGGLMRLGFKHTSVTAEHFNGVGNSDPRFATYMSTSRTAVTFSSGYSYFSHAPDTNHHIWIIDERNHKASIDDEVINIPSTRKDFNPNVYAQGFLIFARLSNLNEALFWSPGQCTEFYLEGAAGNALISLIPVRFTNENGVSEGAMFDRISGKLFRNAGTGAFVIGPDKTT